MIEAYAILNDIHFPYEDKSRYQVALNILQSLKLNHIYLNGDIGEFQGVSSHPVHPSEKSVNFSAEISYINKRFDELTVTFKDVPVTLIEGNHCYRFFRYIRDIAPELWGVIDCPQILNFHERPNWKFVPYGPDQLVKCGKANLYLRHEPLGGGQNPAKLTAEHAHCDIAFGHVHTYQTHSHRKFGPSPFTTKAYALGWLGDKSRHCFDYRGSKDRWVTGCTVVECDPESGSYTLDFVCLDKIPVFYRGQLFDAKVQDSDQSVDGTGD